MLARMPAVPTTDELRAQIATLDELDRKVLGGTMAVWMVAPEKVRDREWVAAQFVQIAVVAHGFDAETGPATSADVERVQAYAVARSNVVLAVAMSLFLRVAADLQARGGTFTFADGEALVRGYLTVASS
jgi:hypothetical protein